MDSPQSVIPENTSLCQVWHVRRWNVSLGRISDGQGSLGKGSANSKHLTPKHNIKHYNHEFLLLKRDLKCKHFLHVTENKFPYCLLGLGFGIKATQTNIDTAGST